MRKFFAATATALILAGYSASVFGQAIWKFDGTQRLAISHDGNGFDLDDVGASAFNWAIVWSFGAVDKMCHFEHSNNLAGATATSGAIDQYLMMMESSDEGARQFGLGEGTGYGTTGIVYDFIKNPNKCIAHFKRETDKNSEGDQIVYLCAGPMESLYRELTATAPEKRRYITCISHSYWNENFTSPGKEMTHTWDSCKGISGNIKFIDIADQNQTLGSGDNGDWSQLKTIGAGNGKTQANWDWLYSRIVAMNKQGDVSDCGMAFYCFTGNQQGTGADLMRQFKPRDIPIKQNNPPFSPIWEFNGTQRLAITHDGNGFNVDDVGASAFNWAIAWSFGAVDKLCHFEHSNNLAGATDTSGSTAQYKKMIESSEGGARHFGLGTGTGYGTTGIVYDFVKNPDAAVAHFKLESDKNAHNNRIVYIIAGPSESLYRELMATEPEKRKYITCIGQSWWGVGEPVNHSRGMAHTWYHCKAIPGETAFLIPSDQNRLLGKGKTDWSAFPAIGTKNGKTQADWDWLFNRVVAMNNQGDVSDCGMAYYVFTGNQNGDGVDIVNRFNNPVGTTSIVQAPIVVQKATGNNNVRLTRSSATLTVSLTDSPDNGTVKVYNLMNRLVCTVPLSRGSAVIPAASIGRGSYIMKIEAGNRKLVKEFIN